MTLNILVYRPYHAALRAYVYDASGIGRNLLSGRHLTDETHATQAVKDALRAKYCGSDTRRHTDIDFAFEYRDGEQYCDLKYTLPSGKVVTVK